MFVSLALFLSFCFFRSFTDFFFCDKTLGNSYFNIFKGGSFIEEKKYYTCKYDRVFKDIFLDPEDTSLLKELLESILKVDIHKITIQNTELREGNVGVRRKHLDALLETNEGVINIEINTSTEEYTKARNFAFLSRVYSNHTLRGENYDIRERFIQINLSYGLNDKELKRIYRIQDEEKKTFVSNVIIYEINMDKCVNLWYTKAEKEIEENKYLIMLNLPKEELERFSSKDKVVKEYMDKLNRINEDPAFLNLIDYEEDNRRMMNSMKKAAIEEGHREGLEEGLKEGHEKGLKQGLQQGLQQGIKERNESIVKTMIEKGLDSQIISEYTNISIEEIEKIRNS